MKFERLVEIMDILRGDNGCPWDKEQNESTLIPFLIEEAYEVVDSIEQGDHENLKEELGDLLFQIIFIARLFKEKELFDIYGVIERISEKMVSRHPHVFGDVQYKTSAEVLEQWNIRKVEEGKFKKSLLDGVPVSMPSLLRAVHIQKRAAKVGFDWEKTEGVFEKIEEETGELKNAMHKKSPEAMEEELGDLLFSIVNLSRFIAVDPEIALKKSIDRFRRRFRYIEEKAKGNGGDIEEMTLAEMDRLWKEAKRELKQEGSD